MSRVKIFFFFKFSRHRQELFDIIDREKKLIDNWSLDAGYSSLNNKSYPLRVFGSGTRDGLTVSFSLNRSEFDDTCRSHVQGFKIQLHMPGVVPQLSKHYIHLPMQRDVLIAVNPQVIRTDEDLVLYAPVVYVRKSLILKMKYFLICLIVHPVVSATSLTKNGCNSSEITINQTVTLNV